MQAKYKNVLIAILGILFMVSLMAIYFLVKKDNEEVKTIQGVVIIADKEYVMLEVSGEDYLIKNIKGNYNVGDEVKFTYKERDLNTKEEPKSIKISDEELIKVKEEEKEEDNNSNGNLDNSNNTSNNTTGSGENTPSTNQNNNTGANTGVSNNTSTSNNNSNTSASGNSSANNSNPSSGSNITSGVNSGSADTEVVNYFNSYKTSIDSSNPTSIGSTLKSGFVTVVDFLFYNGTIKGYRFNDLTSTAKLKVLAMALYFDNKIEKYFPGYKETISNTASKIYTNVKSKVVNAYLNITTSICSSNAELCGDAKEGFGKLKKNFGLTWDLIKDIAGDGLANLKSWYEIWRET